MNRDRRRLFLASCLALVTVAMPFAIRTDILGALGREFDLSHRQQGLVFTMIAWAYPASILLAGLLCDTLGMGRLLRAASVGHVVGVALMIASPSFGFAALLGATVIIGLADGIVEAVINPLAARLYPGDRTGIINRLHAAWPVGMVAAGVGCVLVSRAFGLGASPVPAAAESLSWKLKMAMVLPCAALYGLLTAGRAFPRPPRAGSRASRRAMARTVLRPGFLVLLACMGFTAVTEGGPDLWIGSVMEDTVGVRGVVYLVYGSLIMFGLRMFGSVFARALTPFGLLAVSCVLASAGLFWLGRALSPHWAFVAVTVFAAGKTCLWPTLLGVAGDRYPRAGSFGYAVLSAWAIMSVGAAAPIMGAVYDHYTIRHLPPHVAAAAVRDGHYSPAAVSELTEERDLAAVGEAEREGAAMTFRYVALVPLAPLAAFLVLGRNARRRPARRR